MKESDMHIIGDWIADVLESVKDESVQKRVRHDVETLCEKYPLYPSRSKGR
jgi:glycine/serine hydroxymethyltransferase